MASSTECTDAPTRSNPDTSPSRRSGIGRWILLIPSMPATHTKWLTTRGTPRGSQMRLHPAASARYSPSVRSFSLRIIISGRASASLATLVRNGSPHSERDVTAIIPWAPCGHSRP